MLNRFLKLSNFFILFLIISLTYFFIVKNFDLNNSKRIVYVNPEISQFFYSSLPRNLKLIKNYLDNTNFIESYKLSIKKDELNLDISIYSPFAINNINDKIIFRNGVISETNYFNKNFVENIKLEDITLKTFNIEASFIKFLYELNNFNQISQIELIDNRRFDLYLSDGRKIMLPKILDNKLIIFLNENLNIFLKDDNFNYYLDLRNFLSHSVRMK